MMTHSLQLTQHLDTSNFRSQNSLQLHSESVLLEKCRIMYACNSYFALSVNLNRLKYEILSARSKSEGEDR